MRALGRPFLLSPVIALLVAITAAAQTESNESHPEIHLLTFEVEAIDGVDELSLVDGRVSIDHVEYRPMQGMAFKIGKVMPQDPNYRVEVANKKGRSRVAVVQQPRADNGFEIRVRLDDGGPSGAAPLSFDLVAVWRRAVPNPMNVVLVTIDSLRPDRLRCYGYQRDTSPGLDELAWSGVRYSRAFSTSSFTPPSHASMFTSRYVGDHGLLTWNRLPDEQLTLAEILTRHGYRTGASVCCSLLSDQDLGQGFEWRREGTRDGRAVVSDGLEFIRRHGDTPFFLWLHLYDVHRPYGRVTGWSQRFGASKRPDVGADEEHYNLLPEDVEARGLSADDLRYITDRYDAGIRYTDAQLQPLFQELATPKRVVDTIVIVTSDHGEALLDHPERRFTHDPFLRSAVTHVPLIIRFPGGATRPKTDNTMASLIDLAPTVLDVLGLEAPPTFQGRSLAPRSAERVKAPTHVFAECWGWEQKKAARSANWLVVHDMKAVATHAFDLRKDPGERKPIPIEQFERHRGLSALAAELEAFVARNPGGQAAPALDPETIRKLRGLGYVR